MATFALTDRFIRNAKGREFFDETIQGLSLRVSKTGVKSWCFHYTSGKRKRLTLGTYPAIGLAKARTLATEARGLVETGGNPSAILASSADTLKAIGQEYLSREGPRLRSISERSATFERLIFPSLGGMQIEAIRRIDIARLLDEIETERGPTMADKTLAFLSRLFSWHASRTEFRSPIVRGMARSRPSERARERTLTDDEIRAIWRGEGVFGGYVRFLLLTAARRTEASDMTWTEINGGDWTLPASRNKAKVDLVRPLSKAALAALPPKLGEWVFSVNGKNPITGFAKFKQALDEASGVTGWTLHDCRRTARSLMSRAGVASDHAERCLGHVISGVRGIYDRHSFREEKAQAFEALAAQIDRIINPSPNVVSIKR